MVTIICNITQNKEYGKLKQKILMGTIYACLIKNASKVAYLYTFSCMLNKKVPKTAL